MIRKNVLWRPCKSCGKMFEPNGKFCWNCDECNTKCLNKKKNGVKNVN